MILDQVRFNAAFLDGRVNGELWTLAAVFENDEDVVVHKLAKEEFGEVLTLPEVAPFAMGPLAERVAELQAIVDKRDEGQWNPIVELFHPDMNVPDIALAVRHLLSVYGMVQALPFGAHVLGAIQQCKRALWVDRATQLEKDQAQEPPPLKPEEDVALTDALERGARRGATAEALWQLLDDIDTASDSIKPDEIIGFRLFYARVLEIAKRRHEHLKSDGYKLSWPLHKNASDSVVPVDVYDDLVGTIENLAQGYAFEPKHKQHRTHATLLSELFSKAFEALRPPLPLLLHCPLCNERHIDEGKWVTKNHHTHSCQECGHTWRPAIVATVGVQFLPGFKNEPELRVGARVEVLYTQAPPEQGTIVTRDGFYFSIKMDSGDTRVSHRNSLRALGL